MLSLFTIQSNRNIPFICFLLYSIGTQLDRGRSLRGMIPNFKPKINCVPGMPSSSTTKCGCSPWSYRIVPSHYPPPWRSPSSSPRPIPILKNHGIPSTNTRRRSRNNITYNWLRNNRRSGLPRTGMPTGRNLCIGKSPKMGVIGFGENTCSTMWVGPIYVICGRKKKPINIVKTTTYL